MLVYDADFPDPFLLRAGDRWFAYATQSGGRNVQVLTSPDLLHWELLGDGLPQLPSWTRPGFTWSPSVLAAGGQYVMYVAVRQPTYDRQAIAIATSPSPAGPFHPVPDGPLVFQAMRGGSIDPDPFVGSDGQATLFWKSDGELVGQPAMVWCRPLTADGLRLRGWRGHRLIQTDAEWEQPLLEAPALWEASPGHFVLFYSAGRWTDDTYGIGYALADSPRGPFRKETVEGAWLASGADVAGPGGQCVVRDEAGRSFLAYHGWAPERVGYENGGARRLYIDRLVLTETGRPARVTDWAP